MIEPIDGLTNGVIGIKAVGPFTIEDYVAIVEPALHKVTALDERPRLLLYLGPEFTGFGEGSWGELTNEIRRTHFLRGAVVTDDGLIRTELNLVKWMLRGEVRTFQNSDYEMAAKWVAG